MQTEITEPKIICVMGLSFKEYYKQNEAFRDKTKERWKKQSKINYEQNRKPKYICECGCEIAIGSKLKHEQSKKHTDFTKIKK